MAKSKKIISVLLALCMMFSVIGVSVYAADANTNDNAVATYDRPFDRPDNNVIKQVIDKYFGGNADAFARFMAATVGQIVTGTYSDHLAEVIVKAYEDGIIVGPIGEMTDEEVKAMLDQIYWVYADNPEPISQLVDCIKMYVNWKDAAIHYGQDGILGKMQIKLEKYYREWLEEHCKNFDMPELPELPTGGTLPSLPDWTMPTLPTKPSETDPSSEAPSETDPTEAPSEAPSETDPTEAPTDEEPADDVPTGDALPVALAIAVMAAAGGAIVLSKKARG